MSSIIVEERAGATLTVVSNRRKADRAPLVVRVEYSTVDEFFSEFTRDVNEGGLFIETAQPLSQGSEVTMRFNLPGGDGVIETQGSVVRISPGDENNPPGMGVEFERLTDVQRSVINQLVRTLRA